jgi:CHAD domain-containing protein
MEGRSGADAEIEWQLDAQDLRVVARWLENAEAADGTGPVTIAPGRTRNHVDTYLDTEDRRLDRAGYSVRLRRARGAGGEATLKSLDAGDADGVRVRLELEEPLDADDPAAVADAPGEVGRRVRALVGGRKLVPLFDLQTRRRVFLLTAAGVESGELLLDETAIREPGGPILSRLRRVEVEVPEGAIEAVGPLVEELRRVCGLQPAVLSKYEAALAATGRQRSEAEMLGRTAIEPGDTIGQVALATLRRHLAVLLAKEAGTRLGDDIEELHDMRVASRRLRAATALFAEFLPAEAERLRPELAWLGREIGAVRDLDVQLAQLDEWAAALEQPDAERLAQLRAALAARRAEARAEMLAALDSPRYDRLVRRFAAMVRSRSGTRTRPARAVAPDLIERRYRALRKAMRRADATGEPDAYHRLRIAGKRFRYAVEFLADVYPGRTKPLVRRTVALQDLLGAYQDGHVAIDRLRALAAEQGAELGAETVFVMGEVAERYRAAIDAIPSEVGPAFERLDGKPWRRFRRSLDEARPAAA